MKVLLALKAFRGPLALRGLRVSKDLRVRN